MKLSKIGNDEIKNKFRQELDNFTIKIFLSRMKIFFWIGPKSSIWTGKRTGKNCQVSSIPVARIPKLFLGSSLLENEMQWKLKAYFEKEEGKRQLNSLFVYGDFSDQPGVLVFPNFDNIFKTKGTKVEIDMIRAHPKKGLFVFNVKNQTSGGASNESVQKESEKHGKLIRM